MNNMLFLAQFSLLRNWYQIKKIKAWMGDCVSRIQGVTESGKEVHRN